MIPATLPKLLKQITQEHPTIAVQYMKNADGTFTPRSYQEFFDEVQKYAAGLKQIGIARGDHVGLISENRPEWLVTDLAVLSIGAVDVPRGNDSMAQELGFILGFSECQTVAVENAEQLIKILTVRSEIVSLKQFIVLDPAFDPEALKAKADLSGLKITTYAEVIAAGTAALAKAPDDILNDIEKGGEQDLATIIFTSGTTGEPKGVMLTQKNFMFQVGCVPDRIDVTPGDIWLSVLPVWHSFERILTYVALGTASALAYSKPIGQIMLADFQTVRPQWMASVPRIWEAVRAGVYRNVKSAGGIKLVLFNFFVGVGGTHMKLTNLIRGLAPDFKKRSRFLDAVVAFIPWLLLLPLKLLGKALVFGKITEKLGGRFIAGISGGGALPPAVDAFFGAAGVLLLEGYGLTETAPVLALRQQRGPVPGTVGTMLDETECKILAEDGTVLPPGEMGLICVRGPQVMRGYYNRPEVTASVLDDDGWLNTGDLGMLTHRGELKLTGRAKDTIVLLGGENIEPLPIEQKITESEFIDTAVVVGQDQKYLGALLIPNREAVERYADENHVPYDEWTDLCTNTATLELLQAEVNSQVNAKSGFRGFERIFRIAVIRDPFEIGVELSAKQEVKRHVIAEKHRDKLDALFA
jgi:long-chain acyl-CoA synthetase